MKKLCAGLILLVASVPASAREVYEGTWVVTNRQINGRMTGVVTERGGNRWHGHFYGVWEGVPYSYEVEFSGTRDNLRGTATVDGASYTWTGVISKQGSFRGSFTGDRYTGSFDLQRKGR